MYHVNENAGWEGQSRKLCLVLALSLKEVSPFQFSDAPVIHQTAPQEVSMSITQSLERGLDCMLEYLHSGPSSTC